MQNLATLVSSIFFLFNSSSSM